MISVDLPEPDTPVIQVNKPTGISKFTPFRLFPVAPFNFKSLLLSSAVRFFGISIFSSPDNERLLNTLIHLRNLGNTVIVVEHDEDAIREADHIIDICPGAGVHGGQVNQRI